ncbi:hypothetical protein HAX54_022633 [Datura stramonium]|uniref:Uncharacterized protein n=1 Tax=Datura stramonium TaxID=4076 RepID=A0ABS8UUW2_DATST|nr:hypothetical protein [Datura stramonium]
MSMNFGRRRRRRMASTALKPIFPVFNRSLLLNDDRSSSSDVESSIRIALKNLFVEEGESTTSDELETIPPGTYCVWKPTISEPSPAKCKKSKSTGSVSKRWPRIQFLRRSNSDGFVSHPEKRNRESNGSSEAGKLKASVTGRNKGDKNEEKIIFYLRGKTSWDYLPLV